MKKLIITIFSFFFFIVINAQAVRTDVVQSMGKEKPALQELKLSATTTAATRLFREKNDLTTVIMVLPKGTDVEVIGSDSLYFHVVFEETDGYIFRRQAVLAEPVDVSKQVIRKPEPVQAEKPAARQESRFSTLEEKYGTSMAAKLIAGKIWKGMTAEMVRDSWGKPNKTNRVISGNTVKEEWIYKSTWLYLENDILTEWGPIQD